MRASVSSAAVRSAKMQLEPSLVIYLIPPAVCALLFHFFVGRGYGQLVLYLLAAILGFYLATALASILQMQWVSLGGVQLIQGLLGALVALLLARRLLA